MNLYKSGTDGRCCIYAGRCFMFTHQVVAVFSMKSRHGRTSNQKSDSNNLSMHIYNLLNFIPIRFETTEPKAFLKRSPQQEQEQDQLSQELNTNKKKENDE